MPSNRTNFLSRRTTLSFSIADMNRKIGRCGNVVVVVVVVVATVVVAPIKSTFRHAFSIEKRESFRVKTKKREIRNGK